MAQKIRFCTSADGVRLAFGVHGSGPPLVRVATWMTHLQHDWESPLWHHWLVALSQGRTLLRYDERGSGVSDRDVSRFSVDAWVEDLEAVVDAAGFERFSLLGLSNGGAVAIAYAARHPERVSHLFLCGGFALGRLRREPSARVEAEAMQSLIRIGWGQANPAFRRIFTTLFVPQATREQMMWFDEMQRISASPETAALMRRARDEVDVTDLLARVVTPTLVMHAQDDAAVPFEQGRELASSIPDARFVPLEGHNHMLLADEPAWAVFLREINTFLPKLPPDDVTEGVLTARETEILRCVAAGMTNQAIAEQLFVSVRTVERHMGNMYEKLGLRGRSGRAAIAARAASLIEQRPD
ncbi:alpha/beta fold hydrolase [Nocardioides sp. NPDC006273]|uniref:alpha/beta fold hydrolase n=1 Tax=Nocardioides sp. NPDC006273 TaxID=3155598 RepID=UPI0033BD8A06